MSFSGPIRFRGPPQGRPGTFAGRTLLGELEARVPPGGVAVDRRTLSDGTQVIARKAGSQHSITAIPPTRQPQQGGRAEEMIRCYIGSAGGLRILDIGEKDVIATITGVENWEVEAVSPNGKIVHMSFANALARLDLESMDAFAETYAVDGGFANALAALPSPDGSRLLVMYAGTITGGGGIVSGIGGFLLVDAETLAPLRAPIYMSFRNHVGCWKPDGSGFYLSTAVAIDYPGEMATEVTESQTDYISEFDADGNLLGSTPVCAWTFEPDAGFGRGIYSLQARGERVYAVLQPEPSFLGDDIRLRAYATPSLPMVGEVAIPALDSLNDHVPAGLSRNGTRLVLPSGNADGELIEIDTGTFTATVHAHADFETTAAKQSRQTGWWNNGVVQNGPLSRIGRPPDPRRYFLSRQTGDVRLLAFRDFDAEPVYTFALDALNVASRYRLISAGPRLLP